MKKLLKIRFHILLALTLGIYSCSHILDQEPLSITHPDVFWSSQLEAEQALSGAYALLKNATLDDAGMLIYGDLPARTLMAMDFGRINGPKNGYFHVSSQLGLKDWKKFYRAANWAFTIEKYVEEMSEELFDTPQDKERVMGEAAFIRALSYFYMARIWGEVPLVHESLETSDQLVTEDGYILQVPRSNEKEVLKYILEVTERAIGLLEYSSPSDKRWAIFSNKASAEALKAHASLWYASRDNDNPELLQQAIDAATNVIQNSNASLIDYVAEGTDGFTSMVIGQSKTGLFEFNISSALNESYRISNRHTTLTGLTLNRPVLEDHNRAASFGDPSYYGYGFMSQPERENDVRKDLFFYNFENIGKETFPMKYAPSSPDPAESGEPYAVFSEANILVFRLADIYLLRAEAYARNNQFNLAIADLDLIRSKAGVPGYAGTLDRPGLFKAIFDERAIELVAEGHSAYDRIRMDYYEGVPWMNSDRKAKKGYFWPINPDMIDKNPALVQTEYWIGYF